MMSLVFADCFKKTKMWHALCVHAVGKQALVMIKAPTIKLRMNFLHPLIR